MAVRFREEEADMEEMTIWEQYTVTLNKDSKVGFGLAISGGRDKPNPDTGDTAVVISDVVRNGPAAGRLHTRDQIVMVNGVSMENVSSNFTIQHLKGCGKTANITVKRPRKIQVPLTNRPNRSASHSNLLDGPSANKGQRRGSDSGSEPGYGLRGRRARSHTPEPNGHPLALMSGFKRLPTLEGSDKPIKATLLKKKPNDEYGLKLGSQIFIKHMTNTGLAAKEGTLQEGDLVLKINGMTTENLSLLETKHLVEKSKGKLTMLVLRDQRQFLVNIPEVDDSPTNSDDDDRRDDSSSELEDISDLDIPSTRGRVSRSEARERRMRRSRAEAAPKIRDSPPLRSAVTRPPALALPTRRVPSDSESDRSASPPPRRDPTDPTKYRTLSGIPVPNPHTAPVSYSMNPAVWAPPHAASSSSRPRKEISESDSDRSASPPPRRSSPRMDDPKRYRVLPDISHPGVSLRPTPVSLSSMRSSPKDDTESDSSSSPPRRQGTPTSPDSRNRYRATPEGSPLTPPADQPRWNPPPVRESPVPKRSDSEASYTSVPEQNAPQTRNTWQSKDGYRVFPETQSPPMPLRQDPLRRSPSPDRPPQEDSSGSDHVPSPPQRYKSTEYDISPSFPVNGSLRNNMSEPRSPTGYSKNEEEPLYSLPPDSPDIPSFPTAGYSSDLRKVEFVKENSVGLRLVGGNDVGIFVAGVQPHSPAHQQGMKEGDQMLQVNGVDFSRMTREEAAMFLLNLRKGEPVEIFSQNKMDIYKKILKSSLGDSFYIRTHFDHEPEGPAGLGFTRGEVFRVVDTMHRGKLGNWLAIRMGNDLHELDKGTIPNQARAETIANLERTQRANSSERQGSGPRAEFWKLRGLRGAKKTIRKSREDLLQLTIQGKYPAYEKVLLREAGFKRPIVIMGPLNDVAMEKLASEMPEEFQLADMVPRSGGEGSSSVIKLETVRQIAEQNKHPLVDITPTAVERLSYIQYHPLVLFLDPHSRKDVKVMRQRLCPNSNKSSRRLFAQARKTRKYYSHLFAERIELQPNSDVWYEVLKDKIHQQQAKPVWVSEVMLEGGEQEELDTLTRTNSSDYLSCDSRATSDYEDTDGEGYTDGDGYTDGEAFTDNEDLADHYPRHESRRNMGVARSSEPTRGQDSPTQDFEPVSVAPPRELPPILHVPKPKPLAHAPSSPVQASDSSPQSDVPPDFRAPNPPSQESIPEPPTSEDLPETHEPASLSAIEEKLQQTRMAEPQEKKPSPPFVVLAHREAVQWRRTQIQGSDTSDDNDEIDDIEWGPATEL